MLAILAQVCARPPFICWACVWLLLRSSLPMRLHSPLPALPCQMSSPVNARKAILTYVLERTKNMVAFAIIPLTTAVASTLREHWVRAVTPSARTVFAAMATVSTLMSGSAVGQQVPNEHPQLLRWHLHPTSKTRNWSGGAGGGLPVGGLLLLGLHVRCPRLSPPLCFHLSDGGCLHGRAGPFDVGPHRSSGVATIDYGRFCAGASGASRPVFRMLPEGSVQSKPHHVSICTASDRGGPQHPGGCGLGSATSRCARRPRGGHRGAAPGSLWWRSAAPAAGHVSTEEFDCIWWSMIWATA